MLSLTFVFVILLNKVIRESDQQLFNLFYFEDLVKFMAYYFTKI